MQRLLYLYPEEWTGYRARETHTLYTCFALAENGIAVTLVTAGGFDTQRAAGALGLKNAPSNFTAINLTRRAGPVRSAVIFNWYFTNWFRSQRPFDFAYIIHLKAAPILKRAGLEYGWEAHEIFAETPPPGSSAEQELQRQEKEALEGASLLVATSRALADALNGRYFPDRPYNFTIAPHGCPPPLQESLSNPRGPLIYTGSIADWKGLPLALEAATQVKIPIRIVGGTHEEWKRLTAQLSKNAYFNSKWTPRVTPGKLNEVLNGARAGLCPTLVETGSGHYSLPMKLFDYARCGLPVVATDLPSLRSLGLGDWCVRVEQADISSWVTALLAPFTDGEQARRWAAEHTWNKRGEILKEAFSKL
jgi:glycosyltransferase involved in cell wall biosynthesis